MKPVYYKSEKQLVTDIIARSMINLPGIKWIIGDDLLLAGKRVRHLASYIYSVASTRNGILLSSNGMGVAICFKFSENRTSFLSFYRKIIFAVCCVGISRLREIQLRESYIKFMRPSHGQFLYLWILGVLPEARGTRTAWELKERIMNEQNRMQLPIYLETTNEQNKKVYEHFGFKVYHEWHVPHRNLVMWFMYKNPD